MGQRWFSNIPRRLILLSAVVLPGLWCASMPAADFHVDSKVFKGGQAAPLSENTTLFRAGTVYDYLTEPESITIFEPGRGQFIVLDPARRTQAEIRTEELLEFNVRLKTDYTARPEPFLQFLANPKFDQRTDPATGELLLSSTYLNYRVTTLDGDSDAAVRQYAEFSDWYAQLNTRLNAGSLPPFARLAVNAILEKRGKVPQKVTLAWTPPKEANSKAATLRSEHDFRWALSDADQRRIQETEGFRARFQKVGLTAFLNGGQAPKRR